MEKTSDCKGNQDPTHVLCASDNTCPGDGGSALTCLNKYGRRYMAGIVSYSLNGAGECEEPNRPGGYALVKTYVPWLSNITDEIWHDLDQHR